MTEKHAEISVADAPERNRYEITVDGTLAGFTQYRDKASVRTFPHTEIEDAYAGRGLATRLIREALDDTRRQEKSVVPLCPAVRRFIVKHPDYLDLVTPQERAKLEAE